MKISKVAVVKGKRGHEPVFLWSIFNKSQLSKREPEFRSYRFIEWLQLDPHPPIYFRVERVENLEDSQKIKNTFIKSIKDNLKGFIKA